MPNDFDRIAKMYRNGPQYTSEDFAADEGGIVQLQRTHPLLPAPAINQLNVLLTRYKELTKKMSMELYIKPKKRINQPGDIIEPFRMSNAK